MTYELRSNRELTYTIADSPSTQRRTRQGITAGLSTYGESGMPHKLGQLQSDHTWVFHAEIQGVCDLFRAPDVSMKKTADGKGALRRPVRVGSKSKWRGGYGRKEPREMT